MPLIMSTDNPPKKPTQTQLEMAALASLNARVLSNGGKMPSEEALKAAIETLADRAMRKA